MEFLNALGLFFLIVGIFTVVAYGIVWTAWFIWDWVKDDNDYFE